MRESHPESFEPPRWLVSGYWPLVIFLAMWTGLVLFLAKSGVELAMIILWGNIIGGSILFLILFSLAERFKSVKLLGWWGGIIFIMLVVIPIGLGFLSTLTALWTIIIGLAVGIIGIIILLYGWNEIKRESCKR